MKLPKKDAKIEDAQGLDDSQQELAVNHATEDGVANPQIIKFNSHMR